MNEDMSAPGNQSNQFSRDPMVQGDMVHPKRSMMTWLLVAVAVVLVAGAVGGYLMLSKSNNKKSNATATTHRVVKLGFIGPLTGDNANYGQVMQRGIELAQGDFNQEGLTFQVLVRDTQCQADKAAAAATELVKAGVVAILGDTCSGATLGALPIANQNKVLILSPSASSPKLTIANDYFFRTYPTDSHQAVFTTQMMYQKGVKKLAILHGADAYGTGIESVAVPNFKQLGGTVVADQAIAAGQLDFKAQMQAIMDLKPDALYVVTNSEASGGAIVTTAKQLGATFAIYGSDALKDTNFLTDVGASGNGITLVAVTPGNRSFLDEYKASYGAEPANATGAQAYDAFMAIANLVKNGATSGTQLLQGLATTDFQGKSGEIKFDKYGDLAGGGYLVYTIKDGQFVLTNQN